MCWGKMASRDRRLVEKLPEVVVEAVVVAQRQQIEMTTVKSLLIGYPTLSEPWHCIRI